MFLRVFLQFCLFLLLPLSDARADQVALQGTFTMSNAPLSTQKAWFDPSKSDAEIAKLLENDSDVNAVNEDGVTGLIFMAGRGNLSGVRMFLEAGADIDFQNPLNGETALHRAIYNVSTADGIKIVRLLMNYGASVSLANKQGMLALHMTPNIVDSRQFLAVVDMLLKHGADINAQTKKGEKTFENNTNFTLLHQLVNADNFIDTRDGVLKYWPFILDYQAKASFEVLPNPGTPLKLDPLEYALYLGFTDVAGFVSDAKKIPFVVDQKTINTYYPNGLTGLMYAICGWRLNKNKALDFLEKGADVTLKTRDFDSVSLDSDDAFKMTALHLAVLHGCYDILIALVQKSPKLIMEVDKNGNSCLHHLARLTDVDTQQKILDVLIEKTKTLNLHATLLNLQNHQGQTFLHALAKTKNASLLTYVVEKYGSFIKSRLVDKNQKTALDYLEKILKVDEASVAGGVIKGKKIANNKQNLIQRDQKMIAAIKKLPA